MEYGIDLDYLDNTMMTSMPWGLSTAWTPPRCRGRLLCCPSISSSGHDNKWHPISARCSTRFD